MKKQLNRYNKYQYFFIQKILDLYYTNALDSYRVRYNNTNSSFKEVYILLSEWKKNKIKSFRTVSSAIEELISLLNRDFVFSFGVADKKKVIDELKAIIKLQDSELKIDVINLIQYKIDYILSQNSIYVSNLFSSIKDLINSSEVESWLSNPMSIDPVKESELFKKLAQLTELLASELIHIGYSKIFLYQLINRTFFKKKELDFDQRFSFVEKVIAEKRELDYLVGFKYNVYTQGDYSNHFESNIVSNIFDDSSIMRPEVKAFLKVEVKSLFKTFEVKAIDFYQAIRKANQELAVFMDLVHYSYKNIALSLDSSVLVVEVGQKEKANIQNTNYVIDGAYLSQKNEFSLLDTLIDKKIFKNQFIKPNVKDKIKSALRYLRMGDEAIELEQKYISYWIALEHIFSVHEKDTSTFERLKVYLSKIHTLYYCKRNILYLNSDIRKNLKKVEIEEELKDKIENSDVTYFLDDSKLDILMDSFKETHPLLYFKIKETKSSFHKTEKIKTNISKHESNIQQHLVRLYRVRNELMHDAAIVQNIESLTGNLKYYLIFILNVFIRHYSEIDFNLRMEKEIGLQEFFLHHDLLYENIVQKSDKEKLINLGLKENILW